MAETERKTETGKKEVSKPVKACSCNEDIGRNIRCPDHGDADKI
jgi:hypothetical protein